MFKSTFYPVYSGQSTDSFTKLFDELFESTSVKQTYPAVDIYSSNGSTFIEVAVTGFDKDDLDAYIEGDKLYITGTLKKDDELYVPKDKEYLSRKIARRNFKLTYQLLKPIAELVGEVKNGILTVELKTDKEEPSRKSIVLK